MMRRFVRGAAVGFSLLLAGSASALPATYQGTGSSGGYNYAATATFAVTGSNLTVTLTNTATQDVNDPNDVLTGVFFDIAGTTLTRGSAVLGAGSTVFSGGTDPGNVVGGEWAYVSGLVGAPGSAAHGISSAGLGLFGPSNLFPGTNLQGPASPNGVQYGITSAGDNSATGNGGISGQGLIHNAVVFTLPMGTIIDPATAISNVTFQWGTALTEPSYRGECVDCPLVPEPRTVTWLAAGVMGLAALYRREHGKTTQA